MASRRTQITASPATTTKALKFHPTLCLERPLPPATLLVAFCSRGHGAQTPSACWGIADLSAQAHELDQKIQDVYKRIQTERKVLEASQLLRQATNNPEVLRRNDAAIREAERSLSYFEDTLRELQSRKMMQAQRTDHSRSGSMAGQVCRLST